MGCVFSSRSSPSFDSIRVVHLNGYVEDFTEPTTVSQVTGKPAKHFLCSPANLLSMGSQRPLDPEARLEPGRLYFLLPHSIYRLESSPVDFVSLATRLTAIGKRSGPSSNTPPATPCSSPHKPMSCVEATKSGLNKGSCGEDVLLTVRSWKPVLESIEERSFEHRCD